MKIAFNPSTVAALTSPPKNKDITFDLRGRNIFARGVEFKGTDTNTWRDIKINSVSIGSNILDLRNGSNTTLTNTNGVVTINSTWRPVVDNLTSDSTTSSLSANQGRVLKSLIDGKSDSGHTHDDRYLKLTGGTMLLGEGLRFHSDDNYFGAWEDARIISLLDNNDKICDGGLIIDERATLDGKEYVTELLRIRDSEFKWKGSNILHSGNSYINGSTITLNGSSITVYSSGTADGRYVRKSGDTMSGALNFANNTWNKVGDDVYMGDHNIGGQLCIMGANGTTGLSFHKYGDASIRKSITFDGNTLYMNGSCDYATLSNQTNLLAMNTVPNKTAATSIGSWSPISGRYVFHQKWTDTSTGGDTADFGIYLDGNLTANMVLDGYYNSVLGFRVIGASGGFLKANGTIDNSTYLTSHQSLSNYYTKGEIDNQLGKYKLKSSIWVPETKVICSNFRDFLNKENLHKQAYEELNLYRFFAQGDESNYSSKYNYPVVDSHAMVFSIDGNNGYIRSMNFDLRSNNVYVTSRVANGEWRSWDRLLNTSDIAGLKNDITLHQYLSNTDTTWWPLIWGGSSHANTSDSTGAVYKSHDKLSWQTSSQTLYATRLRTTFIDLENNRGISRVTTGGTSPYKGIKLPDLQSNGLGMFSKIGEGDGADEGGIIISADTSVIYNSFDTGWGLTIRDKDKSQMDISGNNTIAFGVRHDYRAYSLGGFEKAGSSNSYVLLGGGDHKLESALNVANADTLDGHHETHFMRTLGVMGSDWNDNITAGCYKVQNPSKNTPGNYNFGMGITLATENHADGENRICQIYFSHSHDYAMAVRTHNNSKGFAQDGSDWTSWGLVPTTAGNIASATKLQTARKIWGQSFDGTADVDNTLRIRKTTGNYCEGIRIQTGDDAWSTIILGATADSGTNTNAWSIHRKSDNNFAISRNSSDGANGLVMTPTGMGLGTTSPAYRLHVAGIVYTTSEFKGPYARLTDQNGALVIGDSTNARISAIGDQIIFNTGSALRFGGTEWKYSDWAGLKYDTTANTIYLGIAEGTVFNYNEKKRSNGILRLPGITTVTPDSGARIGNSGGDLYLGNSNNMAWVKVQDMCSQSDGNNWRIYQGGNAVFKSLNVVGNITAGGYVKNGSSDAYILLGGGGHKALSDFAYGNNYVKAFGTSNANIDSDWGQSFKTFDPIPSGTPPEQNPNISLLSIGENFDRRKQLAFIWNNDNIYYRRRVGGEGFSNWRRLAFANEIPTSLPANGGNADTVDGEHASSFVRAGNFESANLNSLDTYSFIKSVNSTVASASPGGYTGWYNVIQAVHRNGAGDGPGYIGQIALGMTTNLSAMFYRIKYKGSWYAWNEVLTTNTGLLRYSRNNVNISSPNCSPIPPSLLEWTVGYPRLYDPEFIDGNNDVNVYNNAGNGVVTVTRVHDTNVGNSSSYIMKVVSASGAIPNYGGWNVQTQTELGKVYTCLFRASIPSGVEIEFNTNSIGSGGGLAWLTNNMGTGKWTWYAMQVYCGSGGSTTFFFSAKSPCTWYLSYVNVIENNRASYAGLRSVYSDYLKQNASLVFGRSELQYFNQYTGVTSGAKNNANPTTDWYHILRMNHANNSGYFVDLAIPFNNNRIQFRRIVSGADAGWRRVITEEPNHDVILREANTSGNVGIGINNPAYKLDVNGQMRAEGFHHWTVNSDNYMLLAGGGYALLKNLIFTDKAFTYTDYNHYSLRFHKLSSICNNLVWVDGYVQGAINVEFRIDASVHPYPYDNNYAMTSIYIMSTDDFIAVSGNGDVLIKNRSGYMWRVGFFYTGKA